MQNQQVTPKVVFLDHGDRIGGVESFIKQLITKLEENNGYICNRISVDVPNHRFGYWLYIIRLYFRIKVAPDILVSSHIDTVKTGFWISRLYGCYHVFREPAGFNHEFITEKNARLLKNSLCVALTHSGLARWRACGFEGRGVIIPPLSPRLHRETKVWEERQVHFKIIMVANLYEEKRHKEFALSLKNLRGVSYELHIFGNSNFDDYSNEVIDYCKNENAIYLHQGIEVTDEILSEFDFGVLASRVEGFGHVLVEFVQSGLPFVSTLTDGVADFLQESSILVLSEDSSKWPEDVTRFMSSPGEVRDEVNRLQLCLKNVQIHTEKYKNEFDKIVRA
jgi:glycosyltransferase involved in cell wall biosynthesis